MKGWVLVTGAAKRIGRVIALDLAAHGWDIVVHCHSSIDDAQAIARMIEALGRQAVIASIDLANAEMAAALIPSLGEEIGMMDALVNNAALFLPDRDDPDGSRHMRMNFEAPRILSKAFRDHLPPREKGCIVNLLDATPVTEGFGGYGRSKAALADLTVNMAKSFTPQVRINAVAPSYTLPSSRQSEADFAALAGNRQTAPEQVAAAVRYSIESTGVTGTTRFIAGNDGRTDPEHQRLQASIE